jgi:ankyrin repeat protein
MMNEEEVDDLLYCSRAGDEKDLSGLLEAHLSRRSKDEGDEVQVFNRLMRDIAESNEPHNTLLHFASANGHLGESADLSIMSLHRRLIAHEFVAAIVNYLLPKSDLSTLLAQNYSGNTPLHWAALNGHLEIVKSLVKRIEEVTPVPAAKDYSNLTEEERDAEEEKEAQKRSNWDVVNNAGKGPMSEAQMNNQEKVVEFLLQHMIAGLSKPSEDDVPASSDEAGNTSAGKVDGSLEGQVDNLKLRQD